MSSFIHADPGGAQIHHGKKAIYGNPNPPYDVHEGDGPPPNGYVMVASPGSPVPADYVARYHLADKLKPADGAEPPQMRSSVNGEPLVMVGGRAIAESIAPDHLKSKPANRPGQPADRNAPAAGQAPRTGPNVIEPAKPIEPAKAK